MEIYDDPTLIIEWNKTAGLIQTLTIPKYY